MLVKIVNSFFEVLGFSSKKNCGVDHSQSCAQDDTKKKNEGKTDLKNKKVVTGTNNPAYTHDDERKQREQASLDSVQNQEKQKKIDDIWELAKKQKEEQEKLEREIERTEQARIAREKSEIERQEVIRLEKKQEIEQIKRKKQKLEQQESERKRVEIIRLAKEKADCEKAEREREEKIKVKNEMLYREEKIRLRIESEVRNIISGNISNKIIDSVKHHQKKTSVIIDIATDERKKSIRRIIEARGVGYLTHFTPLDNLSSIINDGIMTRDWLDIQSRRYEFCDQQRLDNKKDASCLSIGLPNYRYFFTLRKQRYPNRAWCVVLLDPSVLWELDAAFYYTNAANNEVRHRPTEEFKTPQALKKMFDSSVYNRIHLERNFNLPSYCTTDPQAEVLVFERIDPTYIKHIVFESTVPFIHGYSGTIPYSAEAPYGTNTFFGRRCDYSFWQNTQRAEVAYG